MKVARKATPSSGWRMPSASDSFLLLSAIHGKSAVGELLVRLAPGEVDVGGVGRGADQHGVAVGEIALQLAIADDLGRADEGEILGPEEQDLPLAIGLGKVDRLAGGQRGGALLDGKGERGKLVANGKHVEISPICDACRMVRRSI